MPSSTRFVPISGPTDWLFIPRRPSLCCFLTVGMPRKATFQFFVNNNNPGENNADLCIPIQRVTSTSPTPAIKYLGVYFDCDLNFKFHIRFICGKISRALYILRTCKNILSPKALKTLYYSLVHCHLIYGNQIWSSASSGIISEQRLLFGLSLIVVIINTLSPCSKR